MTKNKGGRPAGEKVRCSGQWTESRYRSFITSLLRSGTRRWAPISEVQNKARVARGLYECAGCGAHVPPTVRDGRRRVQNIFVDHIDPVVPTDIGFTTWDDYIDRMFAETDNLQLLCAKCHTDIKSKEEREERTTIAQFRKEHNSTYQTWANMNQRCSNPKATGYQYYGGKGITVCDRWRQGQGVTGINNFVEDMGYRPEGATLDRIDYTKGYSKENCRWATFVEQARNTSQNNWIEYEGECKVLQEWGEELGIKPNTILTRLRRGWSVGQALGKEQNPNPQYNGRLTPDDLIFIQEKLNIGWSQTKIGGELEIDPSQISRICKRFNLKKEEKEGKLHGTDSE